MDLDDTVVMTLLSDDDDDDSQNLEDDNASQLIQQSLEKQMESERLPHNQRKFGLQNDGEENKTPSLNTLQEILTAEEDFEITAEDEEGNISDDGAIIVETTDNLIIEEVDKTLAKKNNKDKEDNTASKTELYMSLIENDDMDMEAEETDELEGMSLTIVEDGDNQDDDDVMLIDPLQEIDSTASVSVAPITSAADKLVASTGKIFTGKLLTSKAKGNSSIDRISTSNNLNSNNNKVIKKLKVSVDRTEEGSVDINATNKTVDAELKENLKMHKKLIPSLYQEEEQLQNQQLQEQKQQQQQQQQHQNQHIENLRLKQKRKLVGNSVISNKKSKFGTKSPIIRNYSKHYTDAMNIYSINEFLLRSLEMVALRRRRYPIDRSGTVELLVGFDDISGEFFTLPSSSIETKKVSTVNVDNEQKPSTSHANNHLNSFNPKQSIEKTDENVNTNINIDTDMDIDIEEKSTKYNSKKVTNLDENRTANVTQNEENEKEQSTTIENLNVTEDLLDKSVVDDGLCQTKQQQHNVTTNHFPTNGRSSGSSTISAQLTDSKSTKKTPLNKKTGGNNLNSSMSSVLTTSTPVAKPNKALSSRGNINTSSGVGSVGGSGNKKQISPQDDFYKKPFEYGWKRELVWRANQEASKDKADVYFITPNGKKLRARSEISPLLEGDLTIDHFCFAREPLGVGPELETVRSAKPSHRATAAAATLAAASATTSINIGKRISKPKGPKGASPPPEGWTATKALKVNNAALLSSSHSGRYSLNDERRQQHSSKMNSSGSQNVSHNRKQQQESLLLGRKSSKVKKSTTVGANTTTTVSINEKSQPTVSTAPITSTPVAATIEISSSPTQFVKTSEIRNSGSVAGTGESSIGATNNTLKGSIKIPISRTPPYHPAVILSPGKEVKSSGVSPVLMTPCTVTCPRAPGQVPQLQCVRCLCLYHHECVGLLPQSTEYRTVRHKVGKEYICKVCQGLSSGTSVLAEKTICLTPVRRDTTLKAPLQFPQRIAVVKGKKYVVVSRTLKSNNSSNTSSGSIPIQISPMSTLSLSSSQPAQNTNDIENDLKQINEGMRKCRYSSSLIPPNMDAIFNAHTSLTSQSISNNFKVSGSRSLLATSSGSGTNDPERLMSDEFAQNILNNKIKERSEQLSKKYASNFFSNVSFAYDALLRIFKYLKIHERPRAASVCKLWNLAAKDTSLWQTVRMKNSRVSNWSGFAAALRRGETKHLDLRKMLLSSGMRGSGGGGGGGSSSTASGTSGGNTLGNTGSSGSGEDTWEEFSDNIGTVTSLETIDLCRCSGRIVERLFKSNSNLRILNALAINDDRLNLSEIYHFHKLEELRLRTTELCTLNGCLMEKVDKSGSDKVEKIMKRTDLQSLSMVESLRHLSLTNVKSWGMNNIEDLSNLRQLVTLELGECGDFGTILPSNVLKKLTNLQRLRLENGQLTNCCTLTILDVIHIHLTKLQQLELINFDIRSGFEEKLSLCKNLLKLLIIPTYISQSATTNHLVLSAVQKVSDTLKLFTWGVTVELLRVTSLYVDQCKESIKTERSHFDECIPVLKPVPGAEKFNQMNDEDEENCEETHISKKIKIDMKENNSNLKKDINETTSMVRDDKGKLSKENSSEKVKEHNRDSQNNVTVNIASEKSHSLDKKAMANDNELEKSEKSVNEIETTSATSDGNKSAEEEEMDEVPQIEILPLDRVEAILSENLPNTKFTIVKVPYHMTCKQHLVE